MRAKVSDIRRAVREALDEEDLKEPDIVDPEVQDDDVEEMSTVGSVGIFGYPTPGPFGVFHMPPRKRVKRKRLRPIWSGRVG